MLRRPFICGLACALALGMLWSSSRVDAQRGDRTGGSGAGGTAFAEADLRAWLTYIASDTLQGRQAYSEGLGLAAAYIARHLEQSGVLPAGDNGGYMQTVRVLGVRTKSRSSVTVTVKGQSRTFVDGAGVTFPKNQGGRQTVTAAAQFVGHGIRLPAPGHDDFAGRTVAGTIVLYMGTKGPSDLSTSHTGLLNARGRDALENRGALAAIGPRAQTNTTPATPAATPSQAGQPGQSGQTSQAGQADQANQTNPTNRQVDFQTARRLDALAPPSLTADDDFFAFVFSASGYDYADLKARAERREALPQVDLGDVRISIAIDADYEVVQTRLTQNIVGMVRGSDPSVADTYVMFGAHYDHVGYRQFAAAPSTGADSLIAGCAGQARPSPRPDDIVYNGADDDGSGTVGLMAIARAFAQGPRPRRSVVFVWHSAEEGGLMGSTYMADHPVVPLDRVAAQLNIDMIGRNRCDNPSEHDTVYLVGSDRISTDLHNATEDANASMSTPMRLDYEFNDGWDAESLYTRSDHYSYAAKGVPVVFFTTGLHRDYHYVTDEVDKILFDKLARVARLAYTTGRNLANADGLPARDRRGPRIGKGQTGRIR